MMQNLNSVLATTSSVARLLILNLIYSVDFANPEYEKQIGIWRQYRDFSILEILLGT